MNGYAHQTIVLAATDDGWDYCGACGRHCDDCTCNEEDET